MRVNNEVLIAGRLRNRVEDEAKHFIDGKLYRCRGPKAARSIGSDQDAAAFTSITC